MMHNPAARMTAIRITTISLFILGTQPLIFAQDTPVAVNNMGYLEYNPVPENKKGTTPLDAPVKAVVEPRRPRMTAMPAPTQPQGTNIATLQQQARLYRQQGFAQQQDGDVDGAFGFYQKAMLLDPTFTAVYNDLGVLYESKGMVNEAEQMYVKALTVDPNYVSAYSNLALLAESQGRLELAASYWQKRIDLGYPGDPWTEKAQGRLNDIALILSKKTQGVVREQEIAKLIADVSMKKNQPVQAVGGAGDLVLKPPAAVPPAKPTGTKATPVQPAAVAGGNYPKAAVESQTKAATVAPHTAKPPAVSNPQVKPAETKAVAPLPKEEDVITAQKRLAEANEKFRKGDFLSAYMDALEAQALDPTSTNINKLVDLLQKKLMSSR